MRPHAHQTQVLVMGAGPAGSTVATLLAREGYRVILVERETGEDRENHDETLLPSDLLLLDLLGLRDKVEASAGSRQARMRLEWGEDHWSWSVFTASMGTPLSWMQVPYQAFNTLLREQAQAQGVTFLSGKEIQRISFDDGTGRPYEAHMMAQDGTSEVIGFDWLVDATGTTGMIATQYLHNRHMHPQYQTISLEGRWELAQSPRALAEGLLALCPNAHAWYDAHPVRPDQFSAEVILPASLFKQGDRTLEHSYGQLLTGHPGMACFLRSTPTLVSLRKVHHGSYLSSQLASPGLFLVGEAACSISPLSLNSLHLTLVSAFQAASCLLRLLRCQIEEERAIQQYHSAYRHLFVRWLTLLILLKHQAEVQEAPPLSPASPSKEQQDELLAVIASLCSGVDDLEDLTRDDEGYPDPAWQANAHHLSVSIQEQKSENGSC